ncbi:MAG: amidohydrolase family protein [Planctomycetota bacterium]
MLIEAKILTNPSFEPELGWIRVEDAVITEIGHGPAPDMPGIQKIGHPNQLLVPAFIDAHAHLPQIDCIGCDGLPLLRWLEEVIFPAETWWGQGGALHTAKTAARRFAREGTVGVAGYLTSHAEMNREVVGWLAANTSMRWLVGRVAMDQEAPEALTMEDLQRPRMRPGPGPVMAPFAASDRRCAISANPRFAVSCSEELLAEIAWACKERANEPGGTPYIQTHLAESLDEIARVSELFPKDAHYTGVYDRLGLLTNKTLLAHCVHLSEEEWAIIAERDSIVVHCPTANTFLQSGTFNLDAAERHGVRIALGSDVAGGPDLAMPRVARAMIEVAKLRRLGADDPASVRVPSPAEAWDLITRGNAEILGWTDAGRIEVGAAADLLLLNIPLAWHDEHLVGRLIYNWRSGLIEKRIFNGHLMERTHAGEQA